MFHRVQARTKVGHSAKLQWLVLHPSVDGEVPLFYEKEKSESSLEVILSSMAAFRSLNAKTSKGMGRVPKSATKPSRPL